MSSNYIRKVVLKAGISLQLSVLVLIKEYDGGNLHISFRNDSEITLQNRAEQVFNYAGQQRIFRRV